MKKSKILSIIVFSASICLAICGSLLDLYKVPGLRPPKNPAIRVLDLDNFTDALWALVW